MAGSESSKSLRTMVLCQDGTYTNVIWWDEIRTHDKVVQFVLPPEGAPEPVEGASDAGYKYQDVGACTSSEDADALYAAINVAIQYKMDTFDAPKWCEENGVDLLPPKKNGTTDGYP